jgi:hypothetical protein
MIEKRPDGTTRGGQEPPDEVQDRPEQNEAYDAVVDGGEEAPPEREEDYIAGAGNETDEGENPDDRAEREAVRDVRRRERSAK